MPRRSIVPSIPLVLVVLFIGSGCAALIYEIVWFQMLQLVIGSSAVSLAVLLGTFMGGMCLGSLAFSRFVADTRHPLRVYAWLEFLIGVAGALVFLGMPLVGHVYTSLVGHGLPGILLRASACVLCLLPPTICMGATLPALARWVERTPRGVAWLGVFYGANTLGAVLGCLLAGFYLLRLYDTAIATFFAVAINTIVAAIAWALARRAPAVFTDPADTFDIDATAPTDAPRAPVASPVFTPATTTRVLVAIGLSGFCALAAEVVWTRILSLLLGATVYTFSIILAVFLAGLALGSSVGAAFARQIPRPGRALACCQVLQIAAIGWAAQTITQSLPYWPVTDAMHASVAAKFQFDLVRCAWAVMPSAVLWGASFAFALASVAVPTADNARLVGRVYAANTLGAIAGAVLTAMILIPGLGTRLTQGVLIGLSLVSAYLAFWPRRPLEIGLGMLSAAAAAVIALAVPPLPWQLVAYGRQIATTDYGAHSIYLGEGMNSSVAVTELSDGARFFHVSGKTEASSLAKDMRLQRMLGHLPALLHPLPRSVLIVGCGAGVTSGSFVLHPAVERIVICDIEPLIPRVVATHFRRENHDVLRDPRVQIVYDDARHFIATTSEKFDLITSDPIHPWVKGSAVLYSQEYFELCKQRLKPGGFVTQWVPLYESDRGVVQSEIATFFSVFPEGTIWANDDEGFGYDTVMLGQVGPLRINVDTLQERFQRPTYARVRASLMGLGLGSAVNLLSTYAGRHADLRDWLAKAEINCDRNLRLQYLAGLQLESRSGAEAYDEILDRRTFPADIFVGSPQRIEELKQALGMARIDP